MSRSTTGDTIDLIGDEARRLIGTEVTRKTGVVRKDAFQRWAIAVGDSNPLYFDPESARAAGYRDVVMPPLFLQDISHADTPLHELQPDGLPARGEVYGEVALPLCPRKMSGGVELVVHHPVYDGDTITASSVITDLVQKHGRSGSFVILTWDTTYTRDDGVVVAVETRSVLARPL
jgi:acyl dehydratase